MVKKKNGNGYGKGTFVDTSTFLSEAFISLGKKGTSPTTSWASQAMLMMFLGKRQFESVVDKKGLNKKHQRIDGNEFTLTYKELEAHGINQKSATRGIDELLAKGFISIVDQGGMYEKHKAVYGLSDNFYLWKPGMVFEKRKRDVHRGYQNPKVKSWQTLKGDIHTDLEGAHPPQKTQTLKGGTPKNKKNKGICR
jgi:hypothetical protein